MGGRLQVQEIGPLTRGVIDRANPSLKGGLHGAARRLAAFRYEGLSSLVVRDGDVVKMTLLDADQVPVTSVCALEPFADWALAVGHSTLTNTCYLYRLAADMSGWFDAADGFHANMNAQPVGTLWSSIPLPPDVAIAEGLGTGYIAHTQALDASTLAFPTKTYVVPGTIATLRGDLGDGGAACDLYFRYVCAYNQHLWGSGFGAGTTASTAFRPELLRFSQINFGTFQLADSITVGNRVRSQREQVVGMKVAGEALFVGQPFQLTRITGFGRSSWFKKPLSESWGVTGPKAMSARGDTLYYMSSTGPMRCLDAGQPEPIRLPIEGAMALLINPETVCIGYDDQRDHVLYFYDAGNAQGLPGVRTFAVYDAVRGLWLGPDDDIGLVIRYVSTVSPVFASAAAETGDGTQVGKPPGPPVDPSGAPSALSTTNITHVTAVANWTNSDPTALTQVELRRQSDTDWIIQVRVSEGETSYQLQGLVAGVAYEWRVAHVRGGVLGTYTGPDSGSQFTTIAVSPSEPLAAPTTPSLDVTNFGGFSRVSVSWGNVTTDCDTEIYRTGSIDPGPPVDGDYLLEATTPPLLSSLTFDVFSSGRYWVRLRHTKDTFTPSDFTSAVDVDVVVSGSVL